MHPPFPVRALHSGPSGDREYLLFTPSGSTQSTAPLIIMLHGCHQEADDFACGTHMNHYAQLHRCYVAYPIQSTYANSAKCWNWYEASHQQRDQGEPAILAELTLALIANHKIAKDQVFIAGFSAGGAMAATMAVIYPELYAALGIHSGVAHGAARDFISAMMAMQHGAMASYGVHPLQSQIPTIVFHGDEDNMVHSTHAAKFVTDSFNDGSSSIAKRYTETIAPLSSRYGYTRTVQTDQQGRIFSEKWMVHGGGHAWYGGNEAGLYVDSAGPNAAQEMMRFFCQRIG